MAVVASGIAIANFGHRGPKLRLEVCSPRLPWLLALCGIAAAAYFFAVLGIDGDSGLGPGVAETLDASLTPSMYVAIYYLAARRWAARSGTQTTRASLRVWMGVLMIVAGLSCLLLAERGITTSNGWGNKAFVLVACGLVGAAGTTFAIWLLRRLVRLHKADLGYAIAYRYGGVALAYLSLAAVLNGYDGLNAKAVGIAACDGVVVVGAFFCAVRIRSELAQAAAMGLTPLIALGLEYLFTRLGVITSTVPFEAPGVWVGVVVATIGIVLLHSDSASSTLWPTSERQE